MEFKKSIVSNQKGKRYDYNIPNGFELIKDTETTVEGEWCIIPMEQDFCMAEDLKFHSSWDWLMPVVRKIVEYCCNESEEAFMSDQYTAVLETVSLAVIEDAWKVVVEFIQWYNENK